MYNILNYISNIDYIHWEMKGNPRILIAHIYIYPQFLYRNIV